MSSLLAGRWLLLPQNSPGASWQNIQKIALWETSAVVLYSSFCQLPQCKHSQPDQATYQYNKTEWGMGKDVPSPGGALKMGCGVLHGSLLGGWLKPPTSHNDQCCHLSSELCFVSEVSPRMSPGRPLCWVGGCVLGSYQYCGGRRQGIYNVAFFLPTQLFGFIYLFL